MSISLFEHNQAAYNAVIEMLADTGKAAVVHPTGTGKSYIAFKLCEQYPDKTVCWLSPSEYIFKTQLENLKADTDGWTPDNVVFFTYAKLMLMDETDLLEINPDYIILDEFHRCGAEMWGEGVDRLLSMYPDTPILGLSATAIRYLDNQRNMADELFDGNIASEMSLGEAIVRGILNPPKYVLSVFTYQEDYDRIKRRVKGAKTKAVRDRAEKYLEALRRALEMSEGLDKIFDKHMDNRTGKYIVFCSNIAHLREMQSKAKDWFGAVDPDPHIYTAYSEDPTTSKEFNDFKNDDSSHLKLLYAIDMLNEGIHVDDISGVILFRPTVSPIIYKQQIGRALAAGKNNVSVIFDIVNNIENLYSIGTIQQEIQIAAGYYRSIGADNYIVNEHFEVIDEVRDAKEIFDELNDILSVPFETMYMYAKQYYEQYGNLEIPAKYRTPEGYTLGIWLQTQKQVYAGYQGGILTDDQIKKLELIGIVWESKKQRNWEKNYKAACAFFREHGHLRIPASYITEDGIRLGVWISNLRAWRKNGIRTAVFSDWHIKKLDEIGMIWSGNDHIWDRNYSSAMKYYERFGNLSVPKGYVDDDGIRLYEWLTKVRIEYRKVQSGETTSTRLSEERISALNEIGMEWRTRQEIQWDEAYGLLVEYFSTHGNIDIQNRYRTKNGFGLGVWLCKQRTKYSKGQLEKKYVERLNKLDPNWSNRLVHTWDESFLLAKRYYLENGNLRVPHDYKAEGVRLNAWLSFQRVMQHKGKLSSDKKEKLDTIGMWWNKTAESERAY